jgi:hypothetical protein
MADSDLVSAQTICCTNPFDLRPAVDGILKRIDQVCATLQESQPLVVLIGEHHGIPAHILIQAMFLDRLAADQNRKIAYGYESPHNLLGRTISRQLPYRLTAEDEAAISASDLDGRMALAACLGYIDHNDAPVSRHAFFKFCMSAGVSMRFNDAALNFSQQLTLNKADPLTADTIRRHAPGHDGSAITGYSPLGVALRNRVIIENAKNHMHQTNAKIYIQNCGRNHIFGNVHDGYTAQDSLTALINKHAVPVLSIFMQARADDMMKSIPQDANLFFDQTLFIKNMARDEFKLASMEEGRFFKRLCKESGVDYPLFQSEGFISILLSTERAQMRKDLKEFSSRWAVINPSIKL